MSEARPEVVRHVDRLLDRLPGLQREFVEAMVTLDPPDRTLTAIADELGYDGAQRLGSTTLIWSSSTRSRHAALRSARG